MAITTAQAAVLEITQSMLGAAPGKELLGALAVTGVTTKSLAALVVATDLWKTDMGYGSLTATQAYTKFVDSLVGTLVPAANKATVVTYLTTNYTNVADGIAALSDAINSPSALTDANWGTAAKTFQNKVAVNAYYSVDKGFATTSLGSLQQVAAKVTADTATVTTAIAQMDFSFSTTANLTANQDNLVGSSLNDAFIGYIFNNSNTLQSGDKISGGGGADSLFADIGNSQNFAITPETSSVETVTFRAEAANLTDGTDNNLYAKKVQIDAERMSGVTYWADSQSRADLVIEDVRILDTQITKDITIEMNGTDPGNVDFGFYFDPHSLRNQTTGNSSFIIKMRDKSATDTAPLDKLTVDGFTFTLGGVSYTIQSQAIDDAKTYEALITAVDAALKADPVKYANLSVTPFASSPKFTQIETVDEKGNPVVEQVSGTTVVLTYSGTDKTFGPTGNFTFAKGTVNPFILAGTLTPGSSVTNTDLVTSKVILDDVGRSNLGGDLVIGSLSTGEINAAGGVQRFEIEVRDNSQLQTITSTNNALQEVTIVNGVTSMGSDAYYTTVKDKGNLSVLGTVLPVIAATGTALPGTATQHDSGYGFSDVRLIDASTFNGKLAFTAEITNRSIEKYIKLTDTDVNPAADNINFVYTGGNGNDTMTVQADGGVLSSRSRIVAGREDFTLALNGGAGDDSISLRIVDATLTGGAQNWYNNQDLNNNVTISGGAGNDTIRKFGAGDTIINGDAGNDTIYSDNTGAQVQNVTSSTGTNPAGKAVWVFNTADQATALAASRNYNDLRSDFNGQNLNLSYNLYKYSLTVNFNGIATATPVVLANTTTYKMTDLELNQAIKTAINSDPTLSKLLIAEDGPANTLLVKSLIDGTMTTANLTVGLTAPLATSLSAAEITAMAAAYSVTEANVIPTMNAAYNTWAVTRNDYRTAMANDGAADMVGAASVTTSDNIITPGTDNDVIVLGTTLGATNALSSNETIKYATGFGNDTVVNFAAAGMGIDHFDFTGLVSGATYVAAGYATNKSINVEAFDVTQANALSLIQAKYAGTYATTYSQVFVAVSAHNVASVYTINHTAGSATADTPVLQGTIHLTDSTPWLSLGAANFVNASSAGYYLLEGPAVGGIAPPAPVPLPSNNLDNQSGSFVLTTGTAYALTDSALVNNNVTLSGYDANDSITISNAFQSNYNAVGVITSTATATAAGDAIINYVSGGITNKIVLTGVVPAGVTVNNIATFNALAVGDLTVPADGSVTINISAAGTSDVSAGNTKAVFAAGNYGYTLTGFKATDVVDLPDAFFATASITNTDFTDGKIIITGSDAGTGNQIVVTLTGVAVASDATVFGVNSFNTTFGAGSLI